MSCTSTCTCVCIPCHISMSHFSFPEQPQSEWGKVRFRGSLICSLRSPVYKLETMKLIPGVMGVHMFIKWIFLHVQTGGYGEGMSGNSDSTKSSEMVYCLLYIVGTQTGASTQPRSSSRAAVMGNTQTHTKTHKYIHTHTHTQVPPGSHEEEVAVTEPVCSA